METTNQTIYIPGKINAVLAYCTLCGSILALLFNRKQRHPFASFHIRQALGVNLLMLFGALAVFNASQLAEGSFWVLMLIMWVIGFAGAVQERENKIPVLGALFQRIFSFIA